MGLPPSDETSLTSLPSRDAPSYANSRPRETRPKGSDTIPLASFPVPIPGKELPLVAATRGGVNSNAEVPTFPEAVLLGVPDMVVLSTTCRGMAGVRPSQDQQRRQRPTARRLLAYLGEDWGAAVGGQDHHGGTPGNGSR